MIYHYAENGAYIGSSTALKCPKTGVDLVPRNATTERPPAAKDGYARVFDGKSWTQVLDRRGVVYWLSHNESKIITELGQDIPEGAFAEQPAAPEMAEEQPQTPAKEPTSEELSALVRKRRNELLTASDWTQLPDVTLNTEAWRGYRQALRDITAQTGFPRVIEWPVAPGAA
ncbi:MAG: hypothetical protein HGB01_06995 [Chlorobiaceae bacterium]|nr:hypothetical protein [Chlorobiaceae bacterium]